MGTTDTDQPSSARSNESEDTLAKAYSIGFQYERDHGSCAQCVLAAIQESFPGLIDDAVFRAAHGLAGGGALSGQGTCGALSGGIMAISAAHGRERQNFAAGPYRHASKKAKRLFDRFVEEYGSCICGQVQTKVMGRSFNLWDPDDYKAFDAAGGHRDKCPDVVGKAARWAAEILLEE